MNNEDNEAYIIARYFVQKTFGKLLDMLKEYLDVKNPSHFVAPITIIYIVHLWEFRMFIIQEPLNALRSFSILICFRQRRHNNYLRLLTLRTNP